MGNLCTKFTEEPIKIEHPNIKKIKKEKILENKKNNGFGYSKYIYNLQTEKWEYMV